jgi:hypothetical protein
MQQSLVFARVFVMHEMYGKIVENRVLNYIWRESIERINPRPRSMAAKRIMLELDIHLRSQVTQMIKDQELL